jgi:hypothetical protein
VLILSGQKKMALIRETISYQKWLIKKKELLRKIQRVKPPYRKVFELHKQFFELLNCVEECPEKVSEKRRYGVEPPEHLSVLPDDEEKVAECKRSIWSCYLRGYCSNRSKSKYHPILVPVQNEHWALLNSLGLPKPLIEEGQYLCLMHFRLRKTESKSAAILQKWMMDTKIPSEAVIPSTIISERSKPPSVGGKGSPNNFNMLGLKNEQAWQTLMAKR